MEIEKKLASFVVDAKYDDLPEETIKMAKAILLTIVGTTVGGATSERAEELVNLVKDWGGKQEATIFIYGGKVPAGNAVFVNSYLGRALDFDPTGLPGIHPAVTYFPVALAAAEIRGGISGKEFLTAVIAGSEVGYRITKATQHYGLDPSGHGLVFSAAAVAGKILGLNKKQMLNALGIAFNKEAGSFQANIDGSLCVRLIQGFTSQSGMVSAILAQRGFTGAQNFVEGIYGHFALYSKGEGYDRDVLVGDLGKRYEIVPNTWFKKYPSCGRILVATDIVLNMVQQHGVKAEDVVDVTVREGGHYELVGHPFEIGDTPRVNAQFNLSYAVANILTRGEPKLAHFEEGAIRELAKTGLIEKIKVERGDPAAGTEVTLRTKRGKVYCQSKLTRRGSAAEPLTIEERMATFWQSINYGGKPLPRGNVEKIITMIDKLEQSPNVCELIPLLLV
jgi:2-methylcitrate dehydratase PrpD